MSRRRSRLAAGAIAAVMLFAGSMAFSVGAGAQALPPGVAPALPGPCDLPLVVTAPLIGAVCTAPAVVDAVADVPGSLTGGVIDGLAQWIASGAAGFLEQAGQAIFSGTEVDLLDAGEGGRPWFLEHYEKMTLIGIALFTPMLLMAVLQAVFTQSFALLVRALANLPIAAIGTAAAISIVGLLLAATDGVSLFLAGSLAGDTRNFLDGVIAGLINPTTLGTAGGVSMFGVALLALFMAVAAFVVWLELLVREAAIYLTVLFLPIGFATYIWPALSAWLRRLMEVIVALILSKLVIVAALALAGSALAAQEGFAALVGAAGMLLLAAFAPFALFKLIPIASMAAISSLEGQGRRGVRAAVPRASSAFYVRQLASSKGRSGGGRTPPPSASSASPPAGENPPPPIRSGSGNGGRLPVGSEPRAPIGSQAPRGGQAPELPRPVPVEPATTGSPTTKTATVAPPRKVVPVRQPASRRRGQR